MTLSYSHGREFIEQIRPILERGNIDELSWYLQRFWPAEKLRGLLQAGHEDAACVALAGLSLVGTMKDCPAVAGLLHDDDGLTAELAEHALWSIWFRAAGPAANEQVASAVRLISQGELDAALERIAQVLAAHPDFAEAYHQQSLIHFLRGQYAEAINLSRAALLLNPWHFGAMAVLGHCYAATGRLEQACSSYRQALQLHPRLQGVRQAIRQIRESAPVNTFTKF